MLNTKRILIDEYGILNNYIFFRTFLDNPLVKSTLFVVRRCKTYTNQLTNCSTLRNYYTRKLSFSRQLSFLQRSRFKHKPKVQSQQKYPITRMLQVHSILNLPLTTCFFGLPHTSKACMLTLNVFVKTTNTIVGNSLMI